MLKVFFCLDCGCTFSLFSQWENERRVCPRRGCPGKDARIKDSAQDPRTVKNFSAWYQEGGLHDVLH